MPENADAMTLWLVVQTQWRAGGMGVVGLDYAEVRRWARELDVPMTPGMWGKIRTLERATLEAQHAENDGGRHQQTGPGHQTRNPPAAQGALDRHQG